MSSSTAAAPIPAILDLGLNYGSILAGIFISLVLYGIGCLQSFIYYVNYGDDKLSIRLLVAFTFILNTVHEFLSCAGIWLCLVSNFGNATYLETFGYPLNVAIIFNSIIAALVQGFFTWRVWILSNKHPLLPIILTPFILAQPAASIAYCVLAVKASELVHISSETLTVLANFVNGTGAAVDIVISASLVTLLLMGRTGFNQSTDKLVVRLVVITVNTGLWTALFGLLSVILLVTLPRADIVYGITNFPISSLYFNTMIATLNVRTYVRATSDNGLSQLSSLRVASGHPSSGHSRTKVDVPMTSVKTGSSRTQTNNESVLDLTHPEMFPKMKGSIV